MPEQIRFQDSHSDEMHEIIGLIPPWIVRWGITLIGCVVAVLLLTSYIVKYPDIIEAKVLINAKEHPMRITWFVASPTETYDVRVKDDQKIKLGDTVLVGRDHATGETTYFKSNTNGTAYVFKGLKDNPKGFELVVVPRVSNYEVQLKLPIRGSGRIRPGQRVILKLEAYPESEFGFLEGEVINMIPTPIDDHYHANVRLKNGLTSNIGKKLPIQSFLQGNADVMLDDKNLLQRMFSTIL